MTSLVTYRPNSGGVNAKHFGAVGDNSTDDTAAIQAAIDYAFANNYGSVFLPKGTYKVTDTIYLDPPVNLRAGTIVLNQFTLTLMGEQTGPSGEPNGARIRAYGDFPVIYVGPGRGMCLRSLKIQRDSPNESMISRASTSVGVALSKLGSKFSMYDCRVYGFYKGVMTSYNGDPLTDSNTFFNCYFEHCYIGLHISASQNYINSLYDCTFEQCKYGLVSDVGKGVNVFGGNFSSYSLQRKIFTISSVSTLTAYSAGEPEHNYRFTATIASPDVFIAAGDYDVFCVKHASWGLIPLERVSYSAGVATFQFARYWLVQAFGFFGDIKALSNIEADLQTITTLYACERTITFNGTGIHATGVHVENPQTVTTLMAYGAGFAGDNATNLSNFYFNWQPSGGDYRDSPADDDHRAVFYCQQVNPFIQSDNYSNGTLTAENWSFPTTNTDPIIIHWRGGPITFRNALNVMNPSCWTFSSAPPFSAYSTSPYGNGIGLGHWDRTPFVATAEATLQPSGWRSDSMGSTPFIGFRHAYGQMPRITPTQLTAIIDNTVGAAGTYPPISGDAVYQILDWNMSTPTALFAKAGHKGWSYGKNFSVDWSYVAGTNCVTVSNTGMFFNGLFIKLDNGSGDVEYVVTGVYPKIGYITVMRASDDAPYILAGTKGTTYTGSSIHQSAISFTQF